MANLNISVKQIAREALPRLIDNLVFPNLVYREVIDAPAAKMGDTVSVRCPVKLSANDFDESEGITPETLKQNTIDVKLDHLATVDMQVGAVEAACDFDSVVTMFIEPAAAALAEKINAEGLSLYRDIPSIVKSDSDSGASLEDLAKAAYALDMQKVPAGQRNAVWHPSASCELKQIPAVVNAEKCGSSAALRTGSIGKVFGIDHYTSQAVASHTSTFTGTLTADAAYTDETAITLTPANGATGTLAVGDLLTVGGKTVTVKSVTAGTGSKLNVTVYPAVTVSSGAVFTPVGSHTANLVFHPNAFAFITRPLAAPAGVESYVTTFNGISLRVVRGYDMKYKREMLSMDVLYAFKTVYPELAVRYDLG